MKFIRKLKISSLYNELLNKYHLILINIILLIISFNLINKKEYFNLTIILIILTILLIKIFLHQKNIFILLIILITLITINFYMRTYIYKNIQYQTEDIYQIIKITEKENSNQLYLKSKSGYYYTYTKKEEPLEVGMNIYINSSLENVSTSHVPNGFDYQDYLFKNNIKGILKINEYQILNKRKNIYSLHYIIDKYISTKYQYQTSSFLKALLIGNKNDLDDNLYTNISKIGIGHLFVISGLHMNIIVLILTKILTLLKVKEEKQFVIILFFLIIYYVITFFMISILRIIITNTLNKLNKKYQLHLSSLDIYSINITLVLLFNPFKLFSYSFILTYLISTFIVIINPLLNSYKINNNILKNIIDSIIISTFSVLVTLPIIININPTINILSIIYNIFYIPFVSYILLPLSIIVIIFPFLENIYLFIINLFINITNKLAGISILEITIPKVNYLVIIIYFILLIYLLLTFESKKKRLLSIVLLLVYVFVISNKIIFNNKDQIYFFDLPVGESTLIIKKFNQGNILIDTGEKGSNDLITFLKKKGIKRIDLLIISHADSDHCGMLDEIVSNFNVKNIMLSKYDSKSMDIYNKFKNKCFFVERSNSFIYKNISFEVLWPYYQMNSSNNNSLVVKITINNCSILMCGDIEKEAEEKLIKLEKDIYVDILKIAHHGSNTSTSDYFLNHVHFNCAVVMSGHDNTFGFPTKEIKNKLNNYQTYYTHELKTVILNFSCQNKKYYFTLLKLTYML